MFLKLDYPLDGSSDWHRIVYISFEDPYFEIFFDEKGINPERGNGVHSVVGCNIVTAHIIADMGNVQLSLS